MYFVYILRSLKDQQHYVGLTENVARRLDEHNQGKSKSTKHRRPFVVIYKEHYPTREEARVREKYLKSYKGSKEKLTILESL